MSEKANVIIENLTWDLQGNQVVVTIVVDADTKKVYSVTYKEALNNG